MQCTQGEICSQEENLERDHMEEERDRLYREQGGIL